MLSDASTVNGAPGCAEHVERRVEPPRAGRTTDETPALLEEFAATIVHELRTPLAIVEQAAGTVLERSYDLKPDQVAEMLQIIQRNSNLATMALGLLERARGIGVGNVSLELELIDLAEIARQTTCDLSVVLLSWHPTEVHTRGAVMVRADPTAVRERPRPWEPVSLAMTLPAATTPILRRHGPRTGAVVEEPVHQIGEVAERVGLSLRTVRYYEEVGLVTPSDRTAGGFRLYTDDDVERLELVKHLKPLGFSLDTMNELLELHARVVDDEAQADDHEQLEEYVQDARGRCDELRQQLEAAEQLAARLERDLLAARR